MVMLQTRRPLDVENIAIPRGQLFIIPERCKGCGFCIDFCPRDVLEETSDMNAKGYHYPIVGEDKDEECIACQFCLVICPEFAVYAEEIPE